MGFPEPRRSQALLAGHLAAVFAISAATEVRLLTGLSVLALLVFHRGAAMSAARRFRATSP